MRRRWIVGAAAVAAGFGYAVRALEVIPSGSAAIVERFGRYSRTLHPGLHTITPFVDTVRNRIDLREQTVPFPLRLVSMYDGNDLPIEFTIQYSVTDPVKATYGTASYCWLPLKIVMGLPLTMVMFGDEECPLVGFQRAV